jgi:hypothetical protein
MAGATADKELAGVLAVFVATDPKGGGQRIVGWFRDATVYRPERTSDDTRRSSFSYYLMTPAANAVLVPEEKRWFVIPHGKGAFGQANVCYPLEADGQAKSDARWMENALEYIDTYALENVAHDPESEADSEIERMLGSTIDRVAGFQSNPRIRRAIEDYAMRWAEKRLKDLGYGPVDISPDWPHPGSAGLLAQANVCDLRRDPTISSSSNDAGLSSLPSQTRSSVSKMPHSCTRLFRVQHRVK